MIRFFKTLPIRQFTKKTQNFELMTNQQLKDEDIGAKLY